MSQPEGAVAHETLRKRGEPVLNILFVTQNYPYPTVTHGGGQDFWHMIDSLRHRHHVYVLTFDDPVHPVSEDALRPYVRDVCVIRYTRTLREKALAARDAVVAGYRFGMPRREWWMRRLVSEWSDRYKIDILHCGWTAMGAYFDATTRRVVRVLDEVDVRFRIEEYAVEMGRMRYEVARKNKIREIAYCRRADFVVTRSETDKRALQSSITGLDVLVLPPVAHTAQLLSAPVQAPETPNILLFVGAMSRHANEEAVVWFVRHVWKKVRDHVPDAVFMIVGADPTRDVLQLSREPGVEVMGYVPDVCPFYQKARVVIAPTRAPSGQLNKVMDGLAAGRPVVATPFANQGTDAPCVIVAASAEDFAAAVTKLLLNEAYWHDVSEASRRLAEARFIWSTDELEAHYEEALRERQI